MPLLPPQFHEYRAALPFGPVIKPQAQAAQDHVHDWRPSAASKDHATCTCGLVALREMVLPPEPLQPVQIDIDLSDEGDGGLVYFASGVPQDGVEHLPRSTRKPPTVVYSDSAREVLRRKTEDEDFAEMRRQLRWRCL